LNATACHHSSEVANAIQIPSQVLPSRKGRQIYQSKLRSDQLLRVVVKEESNAYHVITAYKTTKVAKYWKGT